MQKNLANFARENPQIEIRVSPRPQKHPLIKGTYINGREKPVCVRNLEPSEIDWDNGVVIIIFLAARLQNLKFVFQQIDKRRFQDGKLVRTEGVQVN